MLIQDTVDYGTSIQYWNGKQDETKRIISVVKIDLIWLRDRSFSLSECMNFLDHTGDLNGVVEIEGHEIRSFINDQLDEFELFLENYRQA